MKTFVGRAAFFGFSLLLVVSGCGQRTDSDHPKTVPVTGTVTYNGSPVEGATVTFLPESSQARGAVGRTDQSGRFTLMTYKPGDGAIPGKFRVTISKTVVQGELTENSLAPPAQSKELLPVRYKNRETTDLTVEVKEGEKNDFTFDLKD